MIDEARICSVAGQPVEAAKSSQTTALMTGHDVNVLSRNTDIVLFDSGDRETLNNALRVRFQLATATCMIVNGRV